MVMVCLGRGRGGIAWGSLFMVYMEQDPRSAVVLPVNPGVAAKRMSRMTVVSNTGPNKMNEICAKEGGTRGDGGLT